MARAWIRAAAVILVLGTCSLDETTALDQTAALTVEAQSVVTHALLTAGRNANNQTTYTTASIAPAANALVTVAVLGRNSHGTARSPVLTGGGMTTWTEIASATFDDLGSPRRQVTIFRAMSASPGSGPLTIRFSDEQRNAQWIVSQWRGVATSGVNGSGAIVRSGTARANAVTGLNISLSPFANPNNVAYGAFGVTRNAAVVTPGGGFTEISEQPSGESTPGDLQAEWRINDNTIDATWGTQSVDAAAVGVEIASGSVSADAVQSSVEASPTSIAAGDGISTITVTARDASGNTISGATVVLAASGTGNTLTQPAGPTNASGIATGTLSSTAAGDKVVSATISGTGVTETATVSVTAAGVNAAQSTVTVAPGSITASSGASASAITVTARDQFGNPIQGATVILVATGSGNALTQPASLTNASGVATGSLSSTTVGDKVVSATINTTGVTQTATVTVTPAAAAQVAFLVEPSSVTAGATITPAVQVEIRDPFNNRVTTATNGVALAIGTNPAGGTLIGGGSVAAVGAVATFGGLSLDKAGSAYTLAASSTGLTGATSASFNVTVGSVSAAQSTVGAAPGSITAGSGVSTITVTARDASGNPILGATVVLAATGTGNTLTQPAGTTNASGVATGTLSSTAAGDKVVSATISGTGVTETATVSVTPAGGSAAQSTVAAAPGSVTASSGASTSTISVTARDQFGNPIQGATVVLAATGSGNTLTQPAGTTNASGVATGTLSSTAVGDKVVSATINAAGVTQTATVTVTPAAAAQVAFLVEPSSVTEGATMTPAVQVEIRDPFSNRVTAATNGVALAIGTNPAGGTLTGGGAVAAVDGVATFGGLNLDKVGSGYTLAASSTGLTGATSASFNVTVGSVSAAQSTVTAAPGSIPAGSGVSTITVTARDGSGNPISGATVGLVASGTGNTLTPPASTTNASGVATGTLSSTVAEAKTVSATVTVSGVTTAISQTAGVTVTPVVTGEITHTLLTAGTNTVNQKVYTTESISPAANALVTVAVLGVNANGVSPSPVLTGGGMTTWTEVASATFDSGAVHKRRVTIYRAMSAAPGSGPLTITFSATHGNAQWIVSQWSGVDQTGANGAGAIVQSGTASGDAVTGLTVPLAAFANAHIVAYGAFGVTRNVAVVTPGSGFTEIAEQPSGEATLGDLQTEWRTDDNTIDATWGALSLNAGAVGVEITAAASGSAPPVVDAAQSSVEASPTSITAGGTATITVTARDVNGTPVSGARVELFATGSGNTLTQPAGTTNASGVATGALRSTTVGAKVVSATINTTGITQTATVTVTHAAAAQLAFLVQPSSVTAGATMTPPVQVEILDQFTNRVSNATSGVALAIGTNPAGGTLTGGGSVAAVGGVARFAGLKLDKAAAGYTLTASSTGLTGAGSTSFNVTVGSVSAAQSTVTAAPGSIPAGSGVSTITVTARDASGNPIAGATVVLMASGTGNTLTPPAGPTNASGVATGALSSTVAEGKTVSATVTVAGVPTVLDQSATVTVTPQGATAITATLLTVGTNTVNQQVYTTAPIAPAANTLVTVAVLAHRSSGATPSPTLSGGGMTTWAEVGSITFDTGTLPLRRLTLFRAMSGAPGSGPLTIAFSANVSHSQWIVSQWDGVETSGVNGAGAIVQTGAAQGDGVSGLTVSLAAFGHDNNVAYGAFGVTSNAAVVMPGGGFTEISEQPSGESTPGDLQAEWRTNDNTIDATWGALNSAALGVEIKAANTGPVVPVASVEVTPASATVDETRTVQLTATLRDANGNVLSGRVVTWTSSNTTVATVSANGLVTGNAAGSATITATSEGQSGTSAITVVRVPVASVSVAPLSASVRVGFTVPLTATPKDASGAPLSGRTITWVSGNTVMATVNGSGLVSGVAEGVVTITATSEGQSGSSAITVLAAPPPGSGVVLVGAGDIAGSGSGDEATALLLDNIPGTVFTAGDNVYTNGTPTEFANYYEPTWGRHKARTRPTPGNHDYNTSGATGYYGYFGAIAGPAGQGYYSYDLGDWHIVALNSNISMSAGSVQEQWLRADLAASTKQCVLAMWHHPRFSSGSHGSSTTPRPLWQALYDFNADVIIVGHDHNYQRFAPQTPAGAADPVRGIRQFVAGMGGRGHYTFTTPIANTEAYNTDTFGVLKLTLFADWYSWEFIPAAGKTYTDSGSGSCH